LGFGFWEDSSVAVGAIKVDRTEVAIGVSEGVALGVGVDILVARIMSGVIDNAGTGIMAT
jgi:hypothetical protein